VNAETQHSHVPTPLARQRVSDAGRAAVAGRSKRSAEPADRRAVQQPAPAGPRRGAPPRPASPPREMPGGRHSNGIADVALAAPIREKPAGPRPITARSDQEPALPSTWAAEIAPPAVTAAAAMATAFLMEPPALTSVRAQLGSGAWLLLALLAVALAVACWRVSLHAQRLASLLLWVASLGLGLLAASSAVAAAALLPALRAAAGFLPWATFLAPLAAAAATLGLGASGLLRAATDLLGSGRRRPAYGALVLLLSLASLGLTYRLLQRSSVFRDVVGGSADDAPTASPRSGAGPRSGR